MDRSKLKLLNYSDKCFIVVGHTKPFREDLKALRGTFSTNLTKYSGVAWVFSKQRLDSVKHYLKTGEVQTVPEDQILFEEVQCTLPEIEID